MYSQKSGEYDMTKGNKGEVLTKLIQGTRGNMLELVFISSATVFLVLWIIAQGAKSFYPL